MLEASAEEEQRKHMEISKKQERFLEKFAHDEVFGRSREDYDLHEVRGIASYQRRRSVCPRAADGDGRRSGSGTPSRFVLSHRRPLAARPTPPSHITNMSYLALIGCTVPIACSCRRRASGSLGTPRR